MLNLVYTLSQLEFTHHIYEEYMPALPSESKPPIIIQTVPHYEISNYYSLSKHSHDGAGPHPHEQYPGHPELVKQARNSPMSQLQ